jgi:hypothetical protein
MDRRSFLTAGSGLTVAGVAAGIGTKALAGEARRSTPTIFDFGAVGDGSTDDSAAFSKALQAAAEHGGMVIVPAGQYAIAKTISFSSRNHIGAAWGLQCEGARLRSRITDGSDVMRMEAHHYVRYFRLTGGLTIQGTERDGNGLHILALNSIDSFYNFLIDGLSVERAGQHGCLLEGNVFECTVANSYFQDNKQNGLTLAQSHKGIISTVNIVNSFFNQNGNIGMACVNFDGPYGGPTDVRVYGGYARDNWSYGFMYNNGTRQAALHQVGFENNCHAYKPGDPNGAHVFSQVSIRMKDCAGYNQKGGATYLVKGWFSGLAYLDGCTQGADADMAATGKSRLIHIDGKNSGHVSMVGCSGGFDVKAGTGVTWEARNCDGPSPNGPLSIKTTATGTA